MGFFSEQVEAHIARSLVLKFLKQLVDTNWKFKIWLKSFEIRLISNQDFICREAVYGNL